MVKGLFAKTYILAALAIAALQVDYALAQTPQALSYELLQSYRHNPDYWIQGLLFHDGDLYEGTGRTGESRLIRYRDDFETPAYTRSLANRYFGEGIAIHQGLLYQLTWQAETGFVYDPADLSRRGGFSYEGEGWGITSSGEQLWMSNGSSSLQRISPDGEVLQRLPVTFEGNALDNLNELEWIDGHIFANRLYDNHIYLIDPETGEVTAYINLDEFALAPRETNTHKVLNGIAWNPERQSLWVTGKYWDQLYEIKVEGF